MTDIPTKVSELVLDPRWTAGAVVIEEGVSVQFIAFEHPRHGWMHFQLTSASAEKLTEFLSSKITQH